MKNQIFVWGKAKENALLCAREEVESLAPYLTDPKHLKGAGFGIMNPDRMEPADIPNCCWLGHIITKGVTSTKRSMTVYGMLQESHSGLHGEMLSGIAGVDTVPECYDSHSILGFDDFIRWVFFKDPKGSKNYLGIDFSIALKATTGVATSFRDMYLILELLAGHGMPKETEVVLLDYKMCEPDYMQRVRLEAGLSVLGDWVSKGRTLFCCPSDFCPKCGQKTFAETDHEKNARFCFLCGAEAGAFHMNGP